MVLAAFVIYIVLNAQQNIDQPCTMEAKLCPGGETYCTPESRDALCIQLYQPVCGWSGPEVQCVRYPCASTFGNGCEACKSPTVLYYTNGECPGSQSAQIANPASSYCIEKGGTLKILETEGGQYGVCTLPDGTDCEEWAYFRGECPA